MGDFRSLPTALTVQAQYHGVVRLNPSNGGSQSTTTGHGNVKM